MVERGTKKTKNIYKACVLMYEKSKQKQTEILQFNNVLLMNFNLLKCYTIRGFLVLFELLTFTVVLN
jgi:hypothetical protein